MQPSTRQTSTRNAAPARPRITSLPVIAAQMADAAAQQAEAEANRLAAAEAERLDAIVRKQVAGALAGVIANRFR